MDNENKSLRAPNRLLSGLKNGTISHEKWREGMSQHCHHAITEAEQDHAQPKLALLETWRCKVAAKKLLKKNSEAELREVFIALSELEHFPPSHYLWNADQTETPLYCFVRMKREPVLRFTQLKITQLSAEIDIQYGYGKSSELNHETIQFERDWRGQLILKSRKNK